MAEDTKAFKLSSMTVAAAVAAAIMLRLREEDLHTCPKVMPLASVLVVVAVVVQID